MVWKLSTRKQIVKHKTINPDSLTIKWGGGGGGASGISSRTPTLSYLYE